MANTKDANCVRVYWDVMSMDPRWKWEALFDEKRIVGGEWDGKAFTSDKQLKAALEEMCNRLGVPYQTKELKIVETAYEAAWDIRYLTKELNDVRANIKAQVG